MCGAYQIEVRLFHSKLPTHTLTLLRVGIKNDKYKALWTNVIFNVVLLADIHEIRRRFKFIAAMLTA